MADTTVDNGTLADYPVSTKNLAGDLRVQGMELVTAIEGGARTDLAKAEDSAHASGDFGIVAMVVRKDTAAALAGADGDYAPLEVDATGRLWVNIGAAVAVPVTDNGASLTVDNAGTFPVQVDGAALTALQLLDDAIATVAAAITTKGMAAAGTDGTNARILKTDAAGELQVDVLTLPNVTIGAAIPAGTNNIGDVDVLSLPALPAGSNAIGKLVANSGVDIGDVDVTSLVPGTGATALGKAEDAAHTTGDVGVMALGLRKDTPSAVAGTDGDYIPLIVDQTGRQYVDAALDSGALMAAGLALTPKFAIIDHGVSGDNTLVSAVASKKIRVLSLSLVASAAVNTRFESGAGGTALSGQMNLAANGGFVLPFNPTGWFETGVNTLLNLELSSAVPVDGMLVYVEVAA